MKRKEDATEQSKISVNKVCFIISAIGEEGSSERMHADKFKEFIIQSEIGDEYRIVRADDIKESGQILNHIVKNIYDANIIIADLTGLNPNVMYELGISHCFKKPIISFISPPSFQLPFDLRSMRTIYYEAFDVASVKKAREEFRKYVDSIQNGEVDNPVSAAFRHYATDQYVGILESRGGNNEILLLVEMMKGLSEEMSGIRRLINVPGRDDTEYMVASPKSEYFYLKNELKKINDRTFLLASEFQMKNIDSKVRVNLSQEIEELEHQRSIIQNKMAYLRKRYNLDSSEYWV